MVKFKTRYLLLELVFETERSGTLTETDVYNAIMAQIQNLHGDLGVGTVKSGMILKVVDVATNIVVVRIGAEAVNYVTTAIPFVVCIGGNGAVLMTHFIGSSIRSCEKRLLEINREALHTKLASSKTLHERRFIQEAICATTGNAATKEQQRANMCLMELFGPKDV
uniref:Ribonuclease P/MRP protein subunit POP5 n=1 Tax=Steinernema glaseri TaxID=37863 RepID=A0A1I7Z7Z1_9BILA